MGDYANKEQLFVYGTLKPGYRNYAHIEQLVISSQPATTRGFLFDLGSYPALVPGGDMIDGVILDVEPEAIQITDRIESFFPNSPNKSLYFRKKIIAQLDSQEELLVWTYVYADASQISTRPRLTSWPKRT